MTGQGSSEIRPFGLTPYNDVSGVYLSVLGIVAQEIRNSKIRPIVLIHTENTVFQGGKIGLTTDRLKLAYKKEVEGEKRIIEQEVFEVGFVFLNEFKRIARNFKEEVEGNYGEAIALFDSPFRLYFYDVATFGVSVPWDVTRQVFRQRWDLSREDGSVLPYYLIDIRSADPKIACITIFNTHGYSARSEGYATIVGDIVQGLKRENFQISEREKEGSLIPSWIDSMAVVDYGSLLPYPNHGERLVAK